MNRLIKWLLGMAAVLCVLFVGVTQLILPGLLDKAIPYAEEKAAEYINGTLTIGSVSRSGGTVLVARDIEIKDKKQQTVASIPEVSVSVSVLKSLTGLDKAVSSVDLEKPVVYIRQDKNESWNYENLLKPSQSETTPFYGFFLHPYLL